MFEPTYKGTVERSSELRRVAHLPRRTEPPKGWEQLTQVLKTPHGEQTLRPIQAQALAELHCCGGLLGPLSVGAGKTLITYLAGRMVGAQRPLLLVPAKLRDKTLRDFRQLRQHWEAGFEPMIRSYEILGRAQHAHQVELLAPDLIIADEAHRLKNPKAAITRRVGRYMSAHPETMFIALSGTMTKRSLMDFAHLAEWCLGEGSPLPLERFALEQWAQALDEDNQWFNARLDPGPLLELRGPAPDLTVGDIGGVGTRALARQTFQRRMDETPGVIVTHGVDVDASIYIDRWDPGIDMPQKLVEAFRRLAELWELPDGQPIIQAVDVWRHARELAMGFWYRWEPEPPKYWLDARREWASFARMVLSSSRTLDSEAQVAMAHSDSPEWKAWAAVRDDYIPRTVPQWITTNYIQEAAHWARANKGIVWVEHPVVGQMLEDHRIPYYGRLGLRADGSPIEDATGPVAASIKANSEGRNLQHYNHNLIMSPPTTGDAWEQLLGRTHRPGQLADAVNVDVFMGCQQSLDGFWQAHSDAQYQRSITGSPQKLLLADIAFKQSRSKS